MKLAVSTSNTFLKASIAISGSKSESNRLLILQQLFKNIQIENCSDSDDSKHLKAALENNEELVDIGHAGTAMRFLTAFYATQVGRECTLTGSERMQERPIKILVEALQSLGASIHYDAEEGYPPLRIKGSKLTKSQVQIAGNVSSQYISALLLIAPSLENGLQINLTGELTSVPYIEMTLSLLKQLGVQLTFNGNQIRVWPLKNESPITVVVESDWSSASYFYSLIALSNIGSEITLEHYKKDSLQGDACLASIYENFGVQTLFTEKGIVLKKTAVQLKETLSLDLKNAPDIAQTIVVTCFGLGMSCDLTGLHTLKIKETDRLVALQNELTKLGASIAITNQSLHLKSSEHIKENIAIETYKDHRMAMAFAPLALKVPIIILEAGVVSKSYPNFWKDLQQLGFQLNQG
ncbi:3-phosphoshikimate 1-carboxyvinyltransferase [Polaribacter pacificus]|uniref:3-phosphoshikimate 1-carboxyvinyltransferase n=1 Tax=Polaribacter pacificus TaxID=1775173 RepID=A0A917HYB7_9FLAO|nr:3-phosphoshikimate 1-carboxyvinyltransferase [Polaribacter pacificus]GGG95386.1 3-phosphoshikimate 1-carboxyvinyltransferase [Polaribacter pacificus]